jgi:hypothetical protein
MRERVRVRALRARLFHKYLNQKYTRTKEVAMRRHEPASPIDIREYSQYTPARNVLPACAGMTN